MGPLGYMFKLRAFRVSGTPGRLRKDGVRSGTSCPAETPCRVQGYKGFKGLEGLKGLKGFQGFQRASKGFKGFKGLKGFTQRV